MTTGTLTRPTAPGRDHTDDDAIHLFCCDENTAMCGLDLTDHAVIDTDDDDRVCKVCQIAEDNNFACPAPGCGP